MAWGLHEILQNLRHSVVTGLAHRDGRCRIGLGLSRAKDAAWARVTEDDRAIKIETDKLEAVIPKKNPKQWMTGIEKESFLDKTTGFREVGDGLMVVDWLMEAGSDEAWGDKVLAPDGHGVGRYTWHTNETDPARKAYALMAHGSSHRKRMVEGPQLCHRMKPVQPEVIRGKDFVAVKTTYKYEYAAPGRKAGSRWTQLIVFPKGERFFVLMDKIDSVNDSEEMFLRNDTPGCVRHEKGDTFSEMYLSYLSGPKGVRIPSSEFFTPFPPDLKFGYRRDTHKTPEHFIRAYHLRDKKTGKDGPWLAGLTLEPVRRLRGVVQPAARRDHRHDRGDPRQAGEGRRILQRRPHRRLLRHHRGNAQGVRPLQGPHRTDRRRIGLAIGEVNGSITTRSPRASTLSTPIGYYPALRASRLRSDRSAAV